MSEKYARYEILYGQTLEDRFTRRSEFAKLGGFAAVYEVEDEKYTTFVAKIPKYPNDTTAVSSIRHEGDILSQVQGANIIKLIYYHDGTVYENLPPYLILEHADDHLWNIIGRRVLSCRHFSTKELLSMFLQISSGMRIVNRTVVHGDINPANILLVENSLKIADFGVAEPIGRTSVIPELRKYRQWEYVAPEYWVETKSTPEMDIYCTGLVFYLAATLQYPYVVSREGDDERACREAHVCGVARNPSDLNSEVTRDMAHIILKMMKKEPEDRFHSWDDIIDALESIHGDCVNS